MRYVITAIQSDENDKIIGCEDPAVIVDTLLAARAHIVTEELANIEFDLQGAMAEDDEDGVAELVSRRDRLAVLDIVANDNPATTITVPSIWAGPANEGGIDWLILPLAA